MSNEKKRPPRPKRKRPVKTDRQARQAAVGRASAEARQLAGVILRVLAGELGPGPAAEELGKSPAQYYKLEVRALEGLLQGCEPRPRGRQPNPEQELAQLQSAYAKLERECARMQALVRVLGKTTGGKRKTNSAAAKRVAEKKKPAGPKKGQRGRRKPTVRALRLAAQISDNAVTTELPGESPTPPARPGAPSTGQSEPGGT